MVIFHQASFWIIINIIVIITHSILQCVVLEVRWCGAAHVGAVARLWFGKFHDLVK